MNMVDYFGKIKTNLLLCLLLIIFSCSQKPGMEDSPGKADTIVRRSIEKHGGLNNWENLKSISYRKTIILFDSLGAEESRITRKHRYQLTPDIQATIEWISNNDRIRIVYENGAASRYVNTIEVLEQNSKEAAKNTVMSSFYVLFQPFKLLDEGTSLEYAGEEVWDDREVEVVRPVYPGAKKSDDEWWYYFDKKSHLLVATKVKHNDHYSMIKNLSYDDFTPLLFNHHRKSYFVDDEGIIQYLRAEYFYEDFDLEIAE